MTSKYYNGQSFLHCWRSLIYWETSTNSTSPASDSSLSSDWRWAPFRDFFQSMDRASILTRSWFRLSWLKFLFIHQRALHASWASYSGGWAYKGISTEYDGVVYIRWLCSHISLDHSWMFAQNEGDKFHSHTYLAAAAPMFQVVMQLRRKKETY